MARRKKEEEPKPDSPDVTEAKVDTDEETAAEEATEAVEETNTEEPEGAETATVEEEVEETEPTLEEQLELARQEAGQNLEGWQRAAAELANYKRRQEEQLKLQRDRIKGEVLEGVISALDDMELAFQNVPEEIDGQLVGWVEGFRLVQRKLYRVLDDQNVMPIPTEGQFDPNFHEAVSYEDSEEHEEGEIIAELRKGYQIGSRVLRPALVRVAK
jgi:molecular chaperone GrpE